MVEVVEYLLVFAITAAVAGFSVVVFNSSLPAIRQTQGDAQASQISGAIELAAANGDATLVLPLSNATISCSGGAVDLVTGGQTYVSGVSTGCGFSVSGLTCECDLYFSRGPDGVGMEVSP